MKSIKYFLGIDVGTQSLTSGIFDIYGNPLSFAVQEYKTFYPKVSWAEQDPADWWQAAKTTVKKCLKESKVDPQNVVAVSMDATSCTILPVKNNGVPLSNAILWMDLRAVKEAEVVTKTKHPIMKYVGGIESAEWMIPKAMWLKNNKLDIYNKADKIIECVDWFNYKLTGKWVASRCNTTCKWNYSDLDGGYPIGLLKKLRISELRKKWPDQVLGMGQYIGTLTKQSSTELGLPQKVIVAQGGIDGYAGMIGLGVIKPGRLALVIGTSTCHLACTGKPVWDSGEWGPYPNVIGDNSWFLEGGQTASGSIIEWLIDNFASRELREAETKKVSVYKILDSKVKHVKAGAEGLIVLDYWQGNRTPLRDPLARGLISGLSLKHNIGHLLRAVYEGISFGTRHILTDMNDHGFKAKEIYACGGGIKNRLWLQIFADVCDIPIKLTKVPEAATLGAAVCAAVGSGYYKTISSAVDSMIKIKTEILPKSKNKKVYDFYFDKYKRLYPKVKDVMREMSERWL